MRVSTDPKYQHLQEDLHVEITAFAPPAEAHARIAYALTELRSALFKQFISSAVKLEKKNFFNSISLTYNESKRNVTLQIFTCKRVI